MATVPIVPGVATVTLDASGNGTCKIGPVGPAEIWAPAVASFSVSTNVNEASCKIYVGDSAVPANFVDGSLTGSTGDATGRVGGYLVPLGWWIWAVWSGGDAGSVATLNVGGMRQI